MSIEAKPFQQATIAAAVKTFKKASGPRRFLVADEVGLGKTIVGSGVIQGLAKAQAASGQPFSVLYVCSNLGIAKQNIDRLLTFLPESERKTAIATVDRPSLLATRAKPEHKLYHVYSLTPATAIPTRKGQRQDGRMEERALALVLLQLIIPSGNESIEQVFRGGAGEPSFDGWVRHYRQQEQAGLLGGHDFRQLFRTALRDTLGLKAGQQLPARINPMLADDAQHSDLLGSVRTALAIAGLRSINPGLVIFDEFQRFRDLTDANVSTVDDSGEDSSRLRDRAAALVLKQIRGSADSTGPALLLLSATPYTPYRGRSEPAGTGDSSANQSSDFFDLVGFLAGSATHAKKAKTLFSELSEELRKGLIDSARGQELRRSLIANLSPLMSRTERPQLPSTDSAVVDDASVIDAELLPCDIAQFCQMQESFKPEDYQWILPLWQSVPLPMQTLGSRYLAWQRSEAPKQAVLTKGNRNKYKLPGQLPHPGLRALMSAISGPKLTLPWTAPSLPWWPLSGGWKTTASDKSVSGKLLVFSRYRAVPTALAGLISYATESQLSASLSTGKTVNYEQANKRRWLQASDKRSGLLELFHPSPFLADIDPLKASLGKLPKVKQVIEQQLRSKLKDLGVRVIAGGKPTSRKLWELLAAIESKAGLWEDSLAAWQSVAPHASNEESSGALDAILQRWSSAAAKDCSVITDKEFSALAALALDSPGVVLLRALSRHCPDASKHLPQIVSVTWGRLRTYLDKAWFYSSLDARESGGYPEAIRSAVLNGNFESVLDEHFWYLSTGGSGDWSELLKDFEVSLGLRDASVTFHDAASANHSSEQEVPAFTLRCHVAVPLTEGRSKTAQVSPDGVEQDAPLRSDEIRKAFNSPFWPNVLVTTSIGQEGIDLHPWCSALAHWDLASSPVALEQREGRITRFASLSVRRAIAQKLAVDLDSIPAGTSPWATLAAIAERTLSDDSGLSPWWVVEGARCQKYFLAVPGSEQTERYDALVRERALYRLVLGMPDQVDLMSILDAEGKGLDQAATREACIDLCAYNIHKSKSGK
jgi:hypothetical protein